MLMFDISVGEKNPTCVDPEKMSEGSNFFLVEGDGERIEMPLKVGHHRLASETPLKWRFTGMPIMTHHWILAW